MSGRAPRSGAGASRRGGDRGAFGDDDDFLGDVLREGRRRLGRRPVGGRRLNGGRERRHQERGDSGANQMERLGLKVARRTRSETSLKPDVLLVDTTGELASWYLCATVVFIGKSLCDRGGQNPAEPISAGVPVIFGPHMRNFASLVQALLRTQAAIEIRDASSLRSRGCRKPWEEPFCAVTRMRWRKTSSSWWRP